MSTFAECAHAKNIVTAFVAYTLSYTFTGLLKLFPKIMSALKLGLAAYLSTSGIGVQRLPSTIAGHAAQQEEAMDTQPCTGHSQFSKFSSNHMETAPAMGHGQFSIFAKPQSWKNVSGTFGTMNLSHILKMNIALCT